MATTIDGATLRKQGAGNSTQLTDTFDYNEYSADDKTGRTFEGKTLLARNGLYSKLRYLGGIFGSADGEGAPIKVNLGNLKRPRKGEFRNGGLLPRSVIVTGALHSEHNQHQGHATAGKRGVLVLAANGTRLAEVERDELTLHDKASAKIERLRSSGGLLALGRVMQQEILTTASPRFAKRLLPTKQCDTQAQLPDHAVGQQQPAATEPAGILRKRCAEQCPANRQRPHHSR